MTLLLLFYLNVFIEAIFSSPKFRLKNFIKKNTIHCLFCPPLLRTYFILYFHYFSIHSTYSMYCIKVKYVTTLKLFIFIIPQIQLRSFLFVSYDVNRILYYINCILWRLGCKTSVQKHTACVTILFLLFYFHKVR